MSLAILRAHSEDSDQTGQMPRLICVFAGHTGHFVQKQLILPEIKRELITYANRESSGEQAYLLSLTRTSAVGSHNIYGP